MQVGAVGMHDGVFVQYKNTNHTMTSLNSHENKKKYVEYVKEFNEIPRRAQKYFWGAQFVGTALGVLTGILAQAKGQLSTSSKSAALICGALGWFVGFCVGAVKEDSAVDEQNELTQNYMRSVEKSLMKGE